MYRETYDKLKAQKEMMMRKKDNQDFKAVEEESKIRMGRDQRFKELEEQRE